MGRFDENYLPPIYRETLFKRRRWKNVKKLLIKRQDSVDLSTVVVRMCFERVVIRISADSSSNLHNFHCENNVKKYRPPTVQTGVYVGHRCGTGTHIGKSGFYVYRQNKGLYWAKRRTQTGGVRTCNYKILSKLSFTEQNINA